LELLGFTQQPLQWLLGFLPQFKAWFDVAHSPPSRAEVKNKRGCTSNSLICLYDYMGQLDLFFITDDAVNSSNNIPMNGRMLGE